MARGNSGRIVIEVDPALKRELYASLAKSGSTLKDWFIKTALRYCGDTTQPSLFRPDSGPGKIDLYLAKGHGRLGTSSNKR